MANTIVSSGTVTANIETIRITSDLSFTQNVTGSNVSAQIQNITSGSWTPLLTQSLSDIRWFVASNEDLSGSIALARDSAGTTQFAYMEPGDSVMVPWSGAMALYAKGFGSASFPTVTLQYCITER